ncbi:MAG TPA: hypothetical protein VN018_05925 [Brevundimonas sp.]|nr:hypothetical protein [Brevundimonas sp.]
MSKLSIVAVPFAAFSLLAACSPPAEAPATPAEPAAAAPAALPTVDAAALRATLSPNETLSVVELPREGSTTVTGEVKGYKSTVWAVPVAAGQTLTATFAPSNTNLYINVIDAADTSGAAVHVGETAGATATITAEKDAVYVIRPFQPRAMARRDETGGYSLTIARR